MGAQEAADFMEVLQNHGALSRRTVALYVMPALTGGSDVREGTEAYGELDLSLGRELSVQTAAMRSRRGIAPDEPLSGEAAVYLRSLIDCVRRGNSRRLDPGLPFNGFSREAYGEVRGAIGTEGMRYLGIDGRSDTLNPARRRMREIRDMELYTEDVPAGGERPEREAPSWIQTPAWVRDSLPPGPDAAAIPAMPDPFPPDPFLTTDFGPDYGMSRGRSGSRKP